MSLLSNRLPALGAAAVAALALLSVTLAPALSAQAQSDVSTCSTGIAVPNPANDPGLVSDCQALLASRDTLAGGATLDWSAGTAITGWEGVTVGGTPRRVTELRLENKGLTGTIPPELGSLASLQGLVLDDNQLTGTIPSELADLTNLQGLTLSRNLLSGSIPAELGSLTSLQNLYLWRNQLTGEIPAELGI